VTAARKSARNAASLDALAATLAGFEGCTLKATAKNLCFYRGAAQARLMIVGEAPGRDEDMEGRPFVGRAGQLLDKMLAAIGLTEADVHITNIVYWRPPGNRTPTPLEAQVCRPFLERQIELVAPELIVALGGAAAKHLFDVADGIMRVRGKVRDIEIGSHRARAIATLHPAYLLRTPGAKRLAWRDLLAIRALLAPR
jgi:DNA polymerase